MLIGHKKIWDFLTKSAAQNRLAHAYIFYGPSEIGKRTLSLEFAKRLFCQNKKNDSACGKCPSCLAIEKGNHPDVFSMAPRQEEKKGVLKTFEMGIDETRALCRQLSLSPYMAEFKIAIIDEADRMTSQAANSFLKTLEEPSGKSLIFLITSQKQAISPTILSRCQAISFSLSAREEISKGLRSAGFGEDVIAKAAKFCAGRPGRALKICLSREILENKKRDLEIFGRILKADLISRMESAREMSQNAPQAQKTLSEWLLLLRDGLLEKAGCDELSLEKSVLEGFSSRRICAVSRQIQITKNILANPSFDSRLALEVMMMKI